MPNYLNPSVRSGGGTDWNMIGQGIANMIGGVGKTVGAARYNRAVEGGIAALSQIDPTFATIMGKTEVATEPKGMNFLEVLHGKQEKLQESPMVGPKPLAPEDMIPDPAKQHIEQAENAVRFAEGQSVSSDPEFQAQWKNVNGQLSEVMAEYTRATSPLQAKKVMQAYMMVAAEAAKHKSPEAAKYLIDTVVAPWAAAQTAEAKIAGNNLYNVMKVIIDMQSGMLGLKKAEIAAESGVEKAKIGAEGRVTAAKIGAEGKPDAGFKKRDQIMKEVKTFQGLPEVKPLLGQVQAVNQLDRMLQQGQYKTAYETAKVMLVRASGDPRPSDAQLRTINPNPDWVSSARRFLSLKLTGRVLQKDVDELRVVIDGLKKPLESTLTDMARKHASSAAKYYEKSGITADELYNELLLDVGYKPVEGGGGKVRVSGREEVQRQVNKNTGQIRVKYKNQDGTISDWMMVEE